jgi:hypothetical protein
MRPKRILSIVMAALATGCLISCGSTGDPAETVATVAGVGSISRAAVNHWTHVEFILLHESIPTRPAPAGVVPDPPSYARCISHLRQTVREDTAQPSSALAAKCKQSEHGLTALTLNKLIAWNWTIGRAHTLGLHASDAEVRKQLDAVIKRRVFYGPDIDRYLKLTGQTMADLLLRSKVQLLEGEIAERAKHTLAALPKGLTEQQRQSAYLRLANQLLSTKSWVAKTSCHKGYVVSACLQYRGPEPPPGATA